MEYIALSELKKLPKNPRTITRDDMERLKESITRLGLLEGRPLIVSTRTGEKIIIAGNQRYEACKQLGIKKAPVHIMDGLTEEQEAEIIIRDNVNVGNWDYDLLLKEWRTENIVDWGVSMEPFLVEEKPEGGGAGRLRKTLARYARVQSTRWWASKTAHRLFCVNAGLLRFSECYRSEADGQDTLDLFPRGRKAGLHRPGICSHEINMQNKYPIYIVSKNRWESRLTAKSMESMGLHYYIVVEAHEVEEYQKVCKGTVLTLDKKFQDEYETFDNLGYEKSKGPGPARNFAWQHSIEQGHAWHWVMDDNIRWFYRLNNNLKIRAYDGAIFRAMEDFCERYENVSMAGPNYTMFCPRKQKLNPVILNTRIYSCNLIKNSTRHRWRGRYNEDTDLSLMILKDKECTVQFNAFLQGKMTTQTMKGGNTDAFYAKEGTLPKSQMLYYMHPDVTKLLIRFGRWHHLVDYGPFKNNQMIMKADTQLSDTPNEYGMELKRVAEPKRKNSSVAGATKGKPTRRATAKQKPALDTVA